jgi:deoxycytidylate deaminase
MTESDSSAAPASTPHGTSELVIGVVGAIGTDHAKLANILEARLKVIGYQVTQIGITSDVIPKFEKVAASFPNNYDRYEKLMNAGNSARAKSRRNDILALGAAAYISALREKDTSGFPQLKPRHAYIIRSLKHPDEVLRLRQIYANGFYLLGAYSDLKRRTDHLISEKRISASQASALIKRDEDEHLDCGQRVADTYHLSDFFVQLDGMEDKTKYSVWRILDLLFRNPYVTPTFDEYAMFLAFSASLRSADLSRQVGAVVSRRNEIIATGANDCPKFGGGQYWPELDLASQRIIDVEGGRDYTLKKDSNKIEQQRIIEEIATDINDVTPEITQKVREALFRSRITDLTEFGRVVHAEMEAILSCGRNGISTRGTTLYSTTFPCHNCAKHIIAAGVRRVVYIEPYDKSKAPEFHPDSISIGLERSKRGVRFEPFVGIGPRRFFDLFSVRLGSGEPIIRKDKMGKTVEWGPENGKLRIAMPPLSYLELESNATSMVSSHLCMEANDETKSD